MRERDGEEDGRKVREREGWRGGWEEGERERDGEGDERKVRERGMERGMGGR